MQGASESDQKQKCKKRLIISYSSAISVSIVSVLVSIERAEYGLENKLLKLRKFRVQMVIFRVWNSKMRQSLLTYGSFV